MQSLSLGGVFSAVIREKTPSLNDARIHTISVSIFYLQAAKLQHFMKHKN